MSKQQPIIIIGGGLTGVTTLYELVSRDIPAILIDSESAVAQGTSYANGGVLHPSLPDPWNAPNIAPVLLASLFDRNAPIKLHLAQVPALLGWGLQFCVILCCRAILPSPRQILTWPITQPAKQTLCGNCSVYNLKMPPPAR